MAWRMETWSSEGRNQRAEEEGCQGGTGWRRGLTGRLTETVHVKDLAMSLAHRRCTGDACKLSGNMMESKARALTGSGWVGEGGL